MLLDTLNEFSDAQAVTVTADGTNVIDLGADWNSAIGRELYLHIKCVETATAAGAATVTFALETDDNAAMSSATTLFTTAAVGKAELVAGAEVARVRVPAGAERYLNLNYAVATGPLTAGKFDAFLSPSVDDTHPVS